MVKLVFAAMACLALCGCADSYALDQKVALANCQAVGIGDKDPHFTTCMQAQIQGRREQQLENAYDNAKKLRPNERMTRRADELF